MILVHLRRNAVAYLALVVALSTGSAYAAERLTKGSVKTRHLAKNAVTSPKVKDGTLTGADVGDGSLSAVDLAAGVLPRSWELSASAPTGGAPALAPDNPSAASYSFSTAGGTAYVRFSMDSSALTCTSGAGEVGLYLDGAPVPGTMYSLAPLGSGRALTIAVRLPVSAGTHEGRVGYNCPSGNPNSTQVFVPSWLVLVAPA